MNWIKVISFIFTIVSMAGSNSKHRSYITRAIDYMKKYNGLVLTSAFPVINSRYDLDDESLREDILKAAESENNPLYIGYHLLRLVISGFDKLDPRTKKILDTEDEPRIYARR